MPNPNGTNQFDRFASTAKHGDAKKLAQSQKLAPMSGAPVSALNAPTRAKRHATGQDKPEGVRRVSQPAGRSGQQPDLPPVGDQPSEEMVRLELLASQWEAVARLPGASPLLKQYAREAREAVG